MASTCIYGYVTMTADLTHEGHFLLLKFCREHCDHLTVGLTTDELAKVQKRTPILCWEQRYAILSNCKYVDQVLPHNGDPKPEAWRKLRFDVLFSGEEYDKSPEFELFREQCPDIPIVFCPRVGHVSTSHIIERFEERIRSSQYILTVGITGNIMKQGLCEPYHILKPIHVAKQEDTSSLKTTAVIRTCDFPAPNNNDNSTTTSIWVDSSHTMDVFGFYRYFDKLPRNWKFPPLSSSSTPAMTTTTTTADVIENKQELEVFPMIAGINSYREIFMNQFYRKKPWCTYIATHVVFESNPVTSIPPLDGNNSSNNNNNSSLPATFPSLLDFANYVANARKFPMRIIQLVQRDGGITFADFCKHVCRNLLEFKGYIEQVEVIITELEADCVVHGDIHSRNLLVHPKTAVLSLIDWGWVTSRYFDLCPGEATALQHMLQTHFDRIHFYRSLLVCPATKVWMDKINKEHDPWYQTRYKKGIL